MVGIGMKLANLLGILCLVALTYSAPHKDELDIVVIPREPSEPIVILEFQDNSNHSDESGSDEDDSTSTTEPTDPSTTTESAQDLRHPPLIPLFDQVQFHDFPHEENAETSSPQSVTKSTEYPTTRSNRFINADEEQYDKDVEQRLKAAGLINRPKSDGESTRNRRDVSPSSSLGKEKGSDDSDKGGSAQGQSVTHTHSQGLHSDEIGLQGNDSHEGVLVTRIQIVEIIRLPYNESDENSSKEDSQEPELGETTTPESEHMSNPHLHARRKRQSQIQQGYSDDTAGHGRALEAHPTPEALQVKVTAPTFEEHTTTTPPSAPLGTSTSPPVVASGTSTVPPAAPAGTSTAAPVGSSAAPPAPPSGSSAAPPPVVPSGTSTASPAVPVPAISSTVPSSGAPATTAAPIASSASFLVCPPFPAASLAPPAPASLTQSGTTTSPEGKSSHVGY